jgi:LCP family protein required for cell wall assembly
MECREVRLLLDHGIEPSSRSPIRARLGFHLAECPHCRAYRDSLHRGLLANLLSDGAPSTVAAPSSSSTPPRRRKQQTPASWVGYGLAIILLLLLGVVVGRVASATLTIRNNVQAYIIPTNTPTTNLQSPTTNFQTPAPQSTEPPVFQSSSHPPDETIRPLPTARPGEDPIPTLIPIRPTAPGATPSGLIPTLEPVTATPRAPLAGSAITVLLLGSDQRPGEQGPSRTDTIVLARIDPGLHRVALLSLPRDLIVEIPGYGYARINAAHVYGDIYPELGGGMSLTRSAVSNLIGVPIDYTLMIDFEGFIGLIDAIGGIDIDVPTALYDGEYPTMDYGYMEVYFEPGLQHMDGTRALQYARIRHMDSDFQRARRQQEVMLAAARQLRTHNPLELLDRIAAATASLRGYVWTDMPEDRMIGLAWALRDTSPDSVERYLIDEQMISLNGEGGGCSSADDYYAACQNQQAIRAVIQQWLGQ